jgi:hypothetical protein
VRQTYKLCDSSYEALISLDCVPDKKNGKKMLFKSGTSNVYPLTFLKTSPIFSPEFSMKKILSVFVGLNMFFIACIFLNNCTC